MDVDPFALVTFTFQVPGVAAASTVTVALIAVSLMLFTVTLAPVPPSKLTDVPLTKPEPVIVRFTVESTVALFGEMLAIVGPAGGGTIVDVDVEVLVAVGCGVLVGARTMIEMLSVDPNV